VNHRANRPVNQPAGHPVNPVTDPVNAPVADTGAALFVGIDIGTSGVRAVAIDAAGRQQGQGSAPLEPPRSDGAARRQSPALWWTAVHTALAALFAQVAARRVQALAVDGTSGTLLATDAGGQPVSDGWMYHDASCADEARLLQRHAPAESAAQGGSSPLARMLRLQHLHPRAARVLHQADWIAGRLAGRFGASDTHNALKLGFDPVSETWPDWMDALGVRRDWLPRVQRPGTPIGPVAPQLAAAFGLPPQACIVAGTTDGVAAFLATGAQHPGDAVTSLGTTLVVKVLSSAPVFAPAYGIYSHRLGDLWLAGGASNSGGGALLRHFSAEQMAQLTPRLRPDEPTGLGYYPLPAPGERFPVHDPHWPSRTTPRPADDAVFFQALLEGVADVERMAFERIAELGAPYPQRLFTVGGGAGNSAWSRLRARRLGCAMATPAHEQAACGAARLAREAMARRACGQAEPPAREDDEDRARRARDDAAPARRGAPA